MDAPKLEVFLSIYSIESRFSCSPERNLRNKIRAIGKMAKGLLCSQVILHFSNDLSCRNHFYCALLVSV